MSSGCALLGTLISFLSRSDKTLLSERSVVYVVPIRSLVERDTSRVCYGKIGTATVYQIYARPLCFM